MIKYVLLGIVQGITEFLPVSSSGHLVILQRILGITHDQLAISVVLHLGTGFALVIFFFRDLGRILRDLRLLWLLSVTTAITVIIGLLGKDFFENLFTSVAYVAFALLVTGAMLIFTRRFMAGKRNNLDFKDAAILGVTQSIAIIPGISRSGITISTLLFRGIDREKSFYFAFLAAIPVIFGAAIFELRKVGFALRAAPRDLAIGFLASFFTGLLSLWILKSVMRRAKLHYFGYYCIAAAIITFLFIK